MARLLYIVDWLPPDHGAVGQLATAEVRARAEAGDDVILIGLSTEEGSRTEEEFGPGKVITIRLKRRLVPRARLRARAIWTLTTNLLLVARSVPNMFWADEVLFTGSPPFLEHLLAPLNMILRRNLVFRIADFHPECLMAEIGEPTPRSLALFHRLTVAIRRRIPHFQVLGEDQRQILINQGVDPDRIELKRSESPVDFEPGLAPLPKPPELASDMVLLYSGNIAFAHDFETFLEGYARHHGEGSGRMKLWLNARGVRADAFEEAVRQRGLPVHRTAGVPIEDLPALLLGVDAHLITLKDEYVGLCVPCKMFACIESERPILFVGSDRSDVHVVCAERTSAGNYHRADIGRPDEVFAALEALAEAPADGLSARLEPAAAAV